MTRAVAVAGAVLVAAWFALAATGKRAETTATRLIQTPAADGGAQRAADLLDRAQRLNPDGELVIQRALLANREGDPAQAKRLLVGLSRSQPDLLFAWVQLRLLFADSDPALDARAQAALARLDPLSAR